MADPVTTVAPAGSGAGSASAAPAAPAAAPVAPAAPKEPVTLPADVAAGVKAGEPLPAGEKPAGTLPEDVHPAVKAERERAQTYRQIASEAFVFDEQGRAVGIRRDFAERVAGQLRGAAPAPTPTPDTAADAAKLDKLINDFAGQYGLLPEQVRGVMQLVDQIAVQRANELIAPTIDASLDHVKSSILAMPNVPAEAAPFLDRWFEEARGINPRALQTQGGRETVIRQALGDYAWSLIRRRAGLPANPAANSPTLLRPGSTPAGVGPDETEQALREKMGLPRTYTEATRKVEGL